MATYNGKYNWNATDTVRFGDMNRIETGIKDAVDAANTAQTRADLGVSNAATAQSRADLGVSNAATAQSAANAAQTSANTANSAINALKVIAVISNTKRTIHVSATAPASAENGDIWIKI